MTTHLPATAAAAVTLALAACLGACAAPSKQTEARALAGEVGELSRVAGVDVDYTEPVTLDTGKVLLEVTMEAAATTADVARVARTAYEGFVDEHEGEEGDLAVRYGDDRIEVRSWESRAEPADVESAALRAAQAAPLGRVWAHVNTQEVERAPYVHTRVIVRVPRSTGAADRRRLRERVVALWEQPEEVQVEVRGTARRR